MNTYKLPPPERGEFIAPNKPVPAGFVQGMINFIAVPGGAQAWGGYNSIGLLDDLQAYFYGDGSSPVSIVRGGNFNVKIRVGSLTSGQWAEQSKDRMKNGISGPYEFLTYNNLTLLCSSQTRPYLIGVRNIGYDPVTTPIAAPAGEAVYNVRGSAPVFRPIILDGGSVRLGYQGVLKSGNQHDVPPVIEFQGGGGSGAGASPIMTLDGIIVENPGSGYTDGVYTWSIKAGLWDYSTGYNKLLEGTGASWANTSDAVAAEIQPTTASLPPIVSPNTITTILQRYIGCALRIHSGDHMKPGDYKIVGVNVDKWKLECRPSINSNATATASNISWSVHVGHPVDLDRGSAAIHVVVGSDHYIEPNSGYTVSDADINRRVHIIDGTGWSRFPLTIIGVDTANNRWKVDCDVTATTGGKYVLYGDQKARDATGKITVSGGRVVSITVDDEGWMLTNIPPVATTGLFEITPTFTTSGTEARFRARLKVSALYVHEGGTNYTSAPQVYALYTGNNGPRAKQGGAGPLTGRYEYAVTYRYKDNTGKIIYETGLSEPFWSVDLASNKSAEIQGIGKGSIWTSGPWANDNDYELRPYPTHVVIYRRGGNSGVFREVMETPWEAVNSGRVYRDSKPDADLGQICSTVGTIPPPKGTRYVQHHARRMWYASGDSLYASKQDDPWVCSNDSNPTQMTAPIKFTPEEGADITGLVSADRVLVVFTANAAYRIDGTTAQDFRLTKIDANGCNMHGSAREFMGGVIWHSMRGVEYWRNGYGVEYVGEAIGPLLTGASAGVGQSAVFTHNGIKMYAIKVDSGDYIHVFSGSGWSRIDPPNGIVRSLSGFTGGLRIATAYDTGNGTEYGVYAWPHTARTGSGSITWPMTDFGSAMHVKSVIGVRALYTGDTGTTNPLSCTVNFRNPTAVFTGTAVTPASKAYGNHILHQRLHGVYGYELQPIVNLANVNTTARVHGLELDIVHRGLAR